MRNIGAGIPALDRRPEPQGEPNGSLVAFAGSHFDQPKQPVTPLLAEDDILLNAQDDQEAPGSTTLRFSLDSPFPLVSAGENESYSEFPTRYDRNHGYPATASSGASGSFVQRSPRRPSAGSNAAISLISGSDYQPSPAPTTPGYHSNDNSHNSQFGDLVESRAQAGPSKPWDLPPRVSKRPSSPPLFHPY